MPLLGAQFAKAKGPALGVGGRGVPGTAEPLYKQLVRIQLIEHLLKTNFLVFSFLSFATHSSLLFLV